MRINALLIFFLVILTGCSAQTISPLTLSEEMKEEGLRIRPASSVPSAIELNGQLPESYEAIKDTYHFYTYENTDEVEKAKEDFDKLLSSGNLALKMNFYSIDNIAIIHQYVNGNSEKKGAELIKTLQEKHKE